MADLDATKSVHATLTGTTVDTVTLLQNWDEVEILNRSGTEPIYFTVNGDTPVAEAEDTDIVMAGEAVKVSMDSETVKLIGDGNDYSVIGVS